VKCAIFQAERKCGVAGVVPESGLERVAHEAPIDFCPSEPAEIESACNKLGRERLERWCGLRDLNIVRLKMRY
jgi:hypothetical protein